jgi:hypothetical protein
MIGRVVRRKDARGQFRFATEACDIVPEQGEFLAAKSHRACTSSRRPRTRSRFRCGCCARPTVRG